MTEAELVEASAAYNDLLMGWTSAFFTGITAFLIAAYMVGNKLTTTQATFINIIYVLYSVLCIVGVYGTGTNLVVFANEVESTNPERHYVASYYLINAAVLTLCVALLGSLKFMWDVRHSKTE